jgi:hypothetical protein
VKRAGAASKEVAGGEISTVNGEEPTCDDRHAGLVIRATFGRAHS